MSDPLKQPIQQCVACFRWKASINFKKGSSICLPCTKDQQRLTRYLQKTKPAGE